MYATSNTYLASQNARFQIEDRIRGAEARRAAHAARAAAREARYVEDPAGRPAPTRTWRLFHARSATA